MIAVKTCSKCSESKPLVEFFSYGKNKGYFHRCKVCESIKRKSERSAATEIRLAKLRAMPKPINRLCPMCCKLKLLSEFGLHKCGPGGLQSYCKPCKVKYTKEYNQKNKDKFDLWVAKSALNANKNGKRQAYSKEYRAKNKELCQKRQEISRSKKPEHYAAKAREVMRRRRIEDPLFGLQNALRCRLNAVLKQMGYTKRSRTHEILGCDWEFFRGHIERQFLKGMAWEKMGAEIHIDHITPISMAKTEEDVIALNHFTNLRPMWAKDNRAKYSKITHLI